MKEFKTHDETPGERAVKAELNHLKINFEQEKRIFNLRGDTKSYRDADFFLQDCDVYIEFLGNWNTNNEHRQRYEEKMRVYKLNSINCIWIYPEQLTHTNKIIQEGLLKYGVKLNKLRNPEIAYPSFASSISLQSKGVLDPASNKNSKTPKDVPALIEQYKPDNYKLYPQWLNLKKDSELLEKASLISPNLEQKDIKLGKKIQEKEKEKAKPSIININDVQRHINLSSERERSKLLQLRVKEPPLPVKEPQLPVKNNLARSLWFWIFVLALSTIVISFVSNSLNDNLDVNSKMDLIECGMSNQELFGLFGDPVEILGWEVDHTNPDLRGEPNMFAFSYGNYTFITQGQYFENINRVAMISATVKYNGTNNVFKYIGGCVPQDFK